MTQGFSQDRLARIASFLTRQYIDTGVVPGAQTLIWRRGAVAHHSVLGSIDLARATPLREDSLFRIYSMTKPLTSVALLMLVEEGKIALDDPVARFLPGFAALGVYAGGEGGVFTTSPPQSAMTVLDLLRHTSGLTYGFLDRTPVDAQYRRLKIGESAGGNDLAGMVAMLQTLPLEFSPGTAWNYSVSTDVVGYLVELAAGMTFAEFIRTRILKPLGMTDTDFFVPAAKRDRFATCYYAKDDKLYVYDDGPATHLYADPPRLESGGGGLAGTAADYLRFCRMLLGQGTVDGVRLLSPKTVALVTMNHLPGKAEIADLMARSGSFNETGYRGVGFGLGVAVTQNLSHAALPGSIGEYGWGGLAGTFFFIDPKEDLILVFMSQVIDNQQRRTRLRRDLRTLIYSAMTESFA